MIMPCVMTPLAGTKTDLTNRDRRQDFIPLILSTRSQRTSQKRNTHKADSVTGGRRAEDFPRAARHTTVPKQQENGPCEERRVLRNISLTWFWACTADWDPTNRGWRAENSIHTELEHGKRTPQKIPLGEHGKERCYLGDSLSSSPRFLSSSSAKPESVNEREDTVREVIEFFWWYT